MPRFFFHVTNGIVPIVDDEGSDCASLEDARILATRIASDLTTEQDYHGCAVVVVDERGNEVMRVVIGEEAD
jgi:hypothetical protein